MSKDQRNTNADIPNHFNQSIRSSQKNNVNEDAKEPEGPVDGAQGGRDASDSPKETQDPEKADSSTEQDHPALSKEIYSVFTVPQKRAIILTGSFVSWFSPMTGSIYFPALNQIARDLGVSSAKVNITVTTYLVGNLSPPFPVHTYADAGCRLCKAWHQ